MLSVTQQRTDDSASVCALGAHLGQTSSEYNYFVEGCKGLQQQVTSRSLADIAGENKARKHSSCKTMQRPAAACVGTYT